MTTTPPLTGVHIGVAAQATRKLLDVLLDRAGISFDTWVALRARVVGSEPPFNATPAAELVALGFATGDGSALSERGRAVHDQVQAGLDPIVAELYEPFDPADLDTTRRVLEAVTERAGVLLPTI